MKRTNKLLSIILALAIVIPCLSVGMINAESVSRTVSKEITLYKWDLTKPSTFWSVTAGTTNPLQETSGSDDNAEFRVDQNGAYILGKNYWPAYNSTGAANNVDLSDPSTKLVVEFETVANATVFIKASFDSAQPDNKGTLYEAAVNGFYRFEKNISSTSNKYVSLQLGVWAGGAVTFKSAKIVKTVSGPRAEDAGAIEKTIKSYNMTDASEMDIHEATNPTFSENGLTMNSTAQWAGLTTKNLKLDISDVSTKLKLNVSNPDGALLAIKYQSNNIYKAESSNYMAGELLLTSETGLIEIYLDKVFTKDQLIALSKGLMKFQVLLGTTNKTVTIHSMEIVKNAVAVFNKSLNMGNLKNYWCFQGFQTAEYYLVNGQTRPLSGVTDTGAYVVDPVNNTLSIKATDYNGIFWYGAEVNSMKIDLNRNPKLKFTVVSSGSRWTLKIGAGGNYTANLFNEYSNPITSGDVTINLADYAESITPAATSSSGVINLAMNFMVLTNGENKPTVIKDLKIEYDNPDPLQEITVIPPVVRNVDTSEAAVLPKFLTIASENYSGDVDVTWTAPDGYDPTVAGTYQFTGTLDAEQLANKGFISGQNVTATVNVKELVMGNVNDDDQVNVKDLVRLKKYLAGIEGVTVYANASDLDNNSIIDGSDLVLLAKMLYTLG